MSILKDVEAAGNSIDLLEDWRMIEIAAIERLDDKARMILFAFAFVEDHMSLLDLCKVTGMAGALLRGEKDVSTTGQRLCEMGILRSERNRYTGLTRYELVGKFTPEALARLLEISVERNWWRIFGYDDTVAHAEKRSVRDFGKDLLGFPWNCTAKAFALRQLLSGEPMAVRFDQYWHEDDIQWETVCDLPCLVDFSSGERLRPKLTKRSPLGVYFKLLAVLLTRGDDVAGLLEHLAVAAKEERIAFSGGEYCEFVSLCVLTGHADWTEDMLIDDDDSTCDDFINLVDALRDGDLNAANDICSLVDKNASLARLDRPAYNLLALLVSAFARPSQTRAAKYIRVFCPNANYKFNDRSEGERRVISDRNQVFCSFLEIVSGYHMKDSLEGKEDRFMGNLAEPVWALLGGMDKDRSAELSGTLLKTAEHAVCNGYPTLASVYLSVFGWALPTTEKARAEALAKRITDAGGVWFRPFIGVAASWQRIVSALDEKLPKLSAKKSSDTGRVKSGRIIWGLFLEEFRRDIQPFFRGPRGADDGSDDKKITLKSLYGGKYDDCLTEADKIAVAALGKSKYSGPRGTSGVPVNVLAALCGQDNLVRVETGDSPKDFVVTPIRLVRREIPLSARSEKGAGMILQVPEWALDRSAPCVILNPEEDVYEFYLLGKDKAHLLDIFREYGEHGTIKLPEEAMAKVRPLLGRMAALIPLQGDLANAAGETGLKRIAGDATPLVRLSTEDDALVIALRVRPTADAKNVVYEPGAGQAERTVALAGGTAVLVRDLADEKHRAEEVEAALADCETWREGRLDWAIDDPAAALSALSAVRGLGGNAHVEWQPGKRIGLAKPRKRFALGATVGADRWFSVSGDCELDDGRVVTLVKLLSRFGERVGRFVPIDENGYVELSRPLLRALEALETAGHASKGMLLVSPAALPMLDTAFAESATEIALPQTMLVEAERIRAAFAERHVASERLKAVLRPYQEEGFEWLARAADGASLVVAPTSVAGNWRGEIRRFAPTLNPIVAGEGGDATWLKAGAHDVAIVSYGLLVSRSAKFLSREWNGVVLDEAQAVKNAETERVKTVKKLAAKFRVAATGTPVENRLTDL